MKIRISRFAGEISVSFEAEDEAEKHQLAFLRDFESKIANVEMYSWQNEDGRGIGMTLLPRK